MVPARCFQVLRFTPTEWAVWRLADGECRRVTEFVACPAVAALACVKLAGREGVRADLSSVPDPNILTQAT